MSNAAKLKVSRELPGNHLIGAWVCWPLFGQVIDVIAPDSLAQKRRGWMPSENGILAQMQAPFVSVRGLKRDFIPIQAPL